MTPLRFRAWHTRLPFDRGFLDELVEFDLTGLDENYIIDSGSYIEDDTVVMQATGLKDKNETEIYEGDVVAYSPSPHVSEFERGTIEWFNAGFCIQLHKGALEPFPWEHNGAGYAEECWTVLGNIHENPNLLPA